MLDLTDELREAYHQEDAEAQYHFALYCCATNDSEEAEYWLKMAAEKGHGLAKKVLNELVTRAIAS